MKLTVVGLGPGAGADLTGRAADAIGEADLIVRGKIGKVFSQV